MTEFAVTRSYHFSAAHQLSNPALSDEENAELYGQCFRPHGHNYYLEVTVAGVDRRRLQARDYGGTEMFAKENLMIVRCADRKLQDLIADVYSSQGHVVEVKSLRTRLEDVFVDTVKRARDDTPEKLSDSNEPVLTRR